MKNFYAPKGSKISINNGESEYSFDLYSDSGFELLSNLMLKVGAEKKLMYQASWLGRPIIQFPNDILVLQELIWSIKPDLIIETGVAHGGSLVLSASILELIGKGKVLGIDIDIRAHNRTAIESHPLTHRINLIEGSSIDNLTIEKIKPYLKESNVVMVMLDSNHSEEHVTEEINIYSNFVTAGSYLIVHDGAQAFVSDIPRGKLDWSHDHPLKSIHKFMKNNNNFKIDENMTRFGQTSSPDGWLKKLK